MGVGSGKGENQVRVGAFHYFFIILISEPCKYTIYSTSKVIYTKKREEPSQWRGQHAQKLRGMKQ